MYTFDSRIRYSETDETGALSLLGVINYMQDCSTFQSEDIGLGVEYLEKKKRAWLLSSWRIVIDRYPVLGERIKIGTWATSSKGIYGYRDFVLMDQEGNYLVKAESVWFFCDTEKMIPVRVMPEDVEAYGEGEALDLGKAPRRAGENSTLGLNCLMLYSPLMSMTPAVKIKKVFGMLSRAA